MKTTYFFILFSLTSIFSFAQIGINTTTPDPSSILDVSAINKGILFPRVELTGTGDNSTIANPAVSLFVYNTSSSNGLTPGFYFWTGSNWSTVAPASNGGGTGSSDTWSLTGNSISGDAFLGTTNYNALKLKVNNNQFALFDPQGGMAIGYGATANNNNSIAIGTNANASTNNQATAVGPSATASGYQSAAIGYNAKAINNNSTLALGNSSTASSFQATAIGVNAKANTSNNALAIGTNSEAKAENATAIGAGAVASQNNAVVLGNITNANVGIGTSTPNTNVKLDVNGNFKLGDRGTVQKNLLSFVAQKNLGTILANGSSVLTIAVPASAQPSSTKATIVITPRNDMDDALYIAWAKFSNNGEIRVKLINTSTTVFYNPYTEFYITINEF